MNQIRWIARVLMGAALLGCSGCGGSLFNRQTEASKAAADKDKAAQRKVVDAPPMKINPTTYFAAGQVHEREGHLLAAADQYRRAVLADPKYAMAFNRLGIVCGRLKMHAEAEDAFERAIAIAPDAAFLRNNQAYARMLQGDYAGAEASLRDALRLNPAYTRARINLGVVLARTARTAEAVESFGMVLPADVAYYNVAVLCVADGRYDAARGAFEQVVALNPDSTDAKRQLEKLRQYQTHPSESLRAELASAAARIAGNLGPPVPRPVTATRPAVVAAPSNASAIGDAAIEDDFTP